MIPMMLSEKQMAASIAKAVQLIRAFCCFVNLQQTRPVLFQNATFTSPIFPSSLKDILMNVVYRHCPMWNVELWQFESVIVCSCLS